MKKVIKLKPEQAELLRIRKRLKSAPIAIVVRGPENFSVR